MAGPLSVYNTADDATGDGRGVDTAVSSTGHPPLVTVQGRNTRAFAPINTANDIRHMATQQQRVWLAAVYLLVFQLPHFT